MNKQEYIYFDPQNPEFCKKWLRNMERIGI